MSIPFLKNKAIPPPQGSHGITWVVNIGFSWYNVKVRQRSHCMYSGVITRKSWYSLKSIDLQILRNKIIYSGDVRINLG